MEYLRAALFMAGFFAITVAAVMLLRCRTKKIMEKTYKEFAEKDNSYTLFIKGYDGGPGVNRLTIFSQKMFADFSDADLGVRNFTVEVESEGKKGSRKVLDAYWSDTDGNELLPQENNEIEKTHIALELETKPGDDFAYPIKFSLREGNKWKTDLEYRISHPKFSESIRACSDWYAPEAEKFRPVKTHSQLGACYFEPENSEKRKKYPLVVWLHGAGEGGTDKNILLLGNKVVNLASDEIQEKFGGAYILCPQAPTFWMNGSGTPYDICQDSMKNKKSMYTEDCKKIIDDFIKSHPVDRNRIYIGGCSNGGYMTINLMLSYPDFFAAAYPVCEAYESRWIDDEQLKSLTSTPIWFTVAKNDRTVDPEKATLPLYRRIMEAGNPDVHLSLFDDVHDESGNQYNGHFSWIYVLNDQCRDKESGQTIFEWMSGKSK